MNNFSVLLVTAIILFSVVGCNENTVVEPYQHKNDWDRVKATEFNINSLKYDELPYTIWRIAKPEENSNSVDSNGVEIFIYDGQTYYHPLHLCQRMEWYLDSYFQTNDKYFLDWSIKYYNKLHEISVTKDDVIYFPYSFTWRMHGRQNDLMEAPWLSAMTQGVALMVHTRLYQFTNDVKYLDKAKKIFNSFDMMVGKSEPWITMIDASNYLWFEEYPNEDYPNFTLNGFIFCIYGIYEYYMVTNNEHAKFLLNAGITTVKKYIEQFRVPGGISYYCLKHKEQYPGYHKIHYHQLKTLFKFTGDKYFSDMADLFYEDYH